MAPRLDIITLGVDELEKAREFYESGFGGRGGVTCTEGEHYLESRGHGSAAKPEQSCFFGSFLGIRGLEIKRAEHLSGSGREMTRMQEMAPIHRQGSEVRSQKSEVRPNQQ